MYLLSVLYLYESNLQYPFSLRGVITGLISLSSLYSPCSPPGHLYLLPPLSLYLILWISLGILGCGQHLGNWLLARMLSCLLTPTVLLLGTSPTSLFSFLWNFGNFSGCLSLWRIISPLTRCFIICAICMEKSWGYCKNKTESQRQKA